MKTLAECVQSENDRYIVKQMRDAWRNTIRKCHNIKHHDYKYYGARGIVVCARWQESFENFFADMGIRPDGLTLERCDNNGNYEPGNCRWATRQEQTENRRCIALVEWQGRCMTVAAWEREFGWKAGVLKARLGRLGYSVEEAFTKSVRCGVKLPGRQYPPRKTPDMSGYPRGMDSPRTKLLASQVLEMRAQHHKEGLSFSALARQYGVTVTTASNAVQAKGAYKEVI